MITFYTNHCPNCVGIKMMMDKKGVEYTEVTDSSIFMTLAADNNIMSMPFADIDGKIINTNELREYLRNQL